MPVQFKRGNGILTLGEVAWEASLGIDLIVKGFKPSPILDDARFYLRGRRLPAPCGCAVDVSYGSSAA
jgi:hypothetical protein